MIYSQSDVLDYVREEDVKFVRLAFCDVFGTQKNVSVMTSELERAFDNGISVDASAIPGFGGNVSSDLFLRPDASTLQLLPWRPSHGRVIRMYCDVLKPDGSAFENDTRAILRRVSESARRERVGCRFGTEYEFYLFLTDEHGDPTIIPHDRAGYMDIDPLDRGVNVRREICLTLSQMDIFPESSHHEEGPGQHEIDFRFDTALRAADNAVTFRSVVKSVASGSGLYASFDPKPLHGEPGSGLHVNISLFDPSTGTDANNSVQEAFIAGILDHIREITLFLNPIDSSYRRLGRSKAPRHIAWSRGNRSQLIRIPEAAGQYRRFELRSPDPAANPYLAFALLTAAGVDGVRRGLTLCPPSDIDALDRSSDTASLTLLPQTLAEAAGAALSSEFVNRLLPGRLIESYAKAMR